MAGVPEAAPRQPPALTTGPVAWVRANLFSSWLNTAVTLVLGYCIVRWALGFIDWAFVNAIWSVPNNQTQACRALKGSEGAGACWAVITEKHRFILFGTYPFEQHWRPAIVCVLFIALYIVSAMRRFWRWELRDGLGGHACRHRRADVGRRARARASCRRSAGAGCRSR